MSRVLLILLLAPTWAGAAHTPTPSSGVGYQPAHHKKNVTKCVKGAPSPSTGRVAAEVTGDFDGDGKPDRFQLLFLPDVREAAAFWPFSRPMVRVIYARGVSTPFRELVEAQSVIGIADLDGDGRDEVLITNGGNTWTTAGILTIRGCQVEPVVQEDGTPYEFGYNGHSNCCLGSGSGFVCPKRGKGRVLIEVSYEPEIDDVDKSDGQAVVDALERPDLTFRWSRRTLRVQGAKVTVVSEESGHSKGLDPSVPMINRFSCGGEDPRE